MPLYAIEPHRFAEELNARVSSAASPRSPVRLEDRVRNGVRLLSFAKGGLRAARWTSLDAATDSYIELVGAVQGRAPTFSERAFSLEASYPWCPVERVLSASAGRIRLQTLQNISLPELAVLGRTSCRDVASDIEKGRLSLIAHRHLRISASTSIPWLEDRGIDINETSTFADLSTGVFPLARPTPKEPR